jgi:membrane associated rhomboid family serine protease
MFSMQCYSEDAMAIGSRGYARPYLQGGGLPRGIRLVLIVTTAIFLLQTFGLDRFLVYYFGLRPSAIFSMFAIWQLVTYMFLHAGIFHILFNMLALWMFGRELEETWGTDRFLRYYFTCGIGAGVCVVLANYLLPFGNPNLTTIGASGAIYGILLASAVLWPDRIVYFNLLFPIKMKYLVMIYGAIAFIGTYSGGGTVSNIAHLGGLVVGWVMLKTPNRSRSFHPIAALNQQYKTWKIERNKRKFQVYMRKHRSDRDTTIN